MKQLFSRLKWPLLLIGLVSLSFVFHRPIAQVGLALTNADYANFVLLGQDFASGQITPFCYGQDYGGSTLTVLRGGWIWLASILTGLPVYAHELTLGFSYLGTPLLMLGTGLLLGARFGSVSGAVGLGVFCLVGTPFWVELYGNDFYFASVILGTLLIWIRTGVRAPLRELTPAALVLAGLLCGLSLYTWRATLVFVLPFLIPDGALGRTIRRLSKPKDRWERAALIWMGVTVSIYLVLQLAFDGEALLPIGAYILRARLCLVLTLAAALVYVLKIQASGSLKPLAMPFGRFALGVGLGLSPEIYYQLRYSERIHAMSWETSTHFWEMLKAVVSKVPLALSELTFGYQPIHSTSVLRFATALLLIWGVKELLQRAAQKERGLEYVLQTAILALLAFVNIRTYVVGATRYLFPLLPALLVGLALAFRTTQGQRKLKWVAGILMLAHVSYQVQSRQALIEDIHHSGRVSQMLRTAEAFRNEGLGVVVADDYWQSNSMTLASDRNPYFISNGRPWGPPEGFMRAQTAAHVGLLLKDSGTAHISVGKRTWTIGQSLAGDSPTGLGRFIGVLKQ